MVQLYVPKIYRMALAMLLQNLYSQGREMPALTILTVF